jgi:hypothetical protein
MPLSYKESSLTHPAVGVLAQEFFFLDLPHAIGTIIGFAAIGCATTAFIATLGPQTGVRPLPGAPCSTLLTPALRLAPYHDHLPLQRGLLRRYSLLDPEHSYPSKLRFDWSLLRGLNYYDSSASPSRQSSLVDRHWRLSTRTFRSWLV